MKKYLLFLLCFILLCPANGQMAEETEKLRELKEALEINEFASLTGDYSAYQSELLKYVNLPTAEEAAKMIKDKNPKNAHPRLFARAEDFEIIKEKIQTDSFSKQLYIKLKDYGETILKQPYFTPALEASDGLKLSRETLDRVLVLGMLYRLDKDQRYVDFIAGQMEVSGTKCLQWPLYNQLPNAEMTFAASLAYDWFYDGFSKVQMDVVKKFIIARLNQILTFYYPIPNSFATQINNWNAVCNGSYGAAALAIGNDEPELAGKVLHSAVKAIAFSIHEMGPNGGYPEGPGYWAYQTQYLTHFLASLFSAIGTDFNLSEIPGFKETAFFPMYVSGPTYKSFNYSDSGEEIPVLTYLYWFAKQFGLDGLQNLPNIVDPSGTNYNSWKAKGLDSLILIWNTPSDKKYYEDKPLNKVYYGRQPVASLRTSWEDLKATFVAFKGGYNQLSHGNIDMGTFVLDSLGKRFISDIGGEDYGLEGYWDFSAGRWKYYSQRAEGHNLFVINPGKHPDQDPYATAKIVEFSEEHQYGIVDLTDAYSKDSIRARRGVALINDSVIIRDELALKHPSYVVWGVNTRAAVTIDPNGKSALLTFSSGESVKVYLLSPSNVKFETMGANSLSYPPFSGEKKFPDVTRLVIKAANITEEDFVVQFSPFMKGVMPPSAFTQVEPLENWENGNYAKTKGLIKQIYLDNTPLPLFNPGKFGYTVELKGKSPIPKLTFEYDKLSATAEIKQAAEIYDSSTITVKSKDPRVAPAVYSVKFTEQKNFGLPKDIIKVKPTQVTASDTAMDPQRTFDERMDTNWAAEGKQWLCYEFDENAEFDTVAISFFMGSERQEKISLEYSNDQKEWTSVYKGLSCGITKDFEPFDIELIKPKYFRISTDGNTVHNWANIAEVAFYKK